MTWLLFVLPQLLFAQVTSVDALEDLNTTLNVKSPLVPVDGCTVFEAQPLAKTYTCDFGLNPKPEKAKGVLAISAYEDNDNLFLGLGMVLMDSVDGNDLGFTHALGMNATYTKGQDEYYFDVTSALYTQSLKGTYHQTGGVPYTSNAYLWSQGGMKTEESVRFVDANKFTVGMKHGKDFYVKGVLGYENRNRKFGTKNFDASNVQNFWHGTLLDAYTFDYVDPEYHPQIISTDGPYPYIARPEIKAEQLKSKMVFKSLIASGAVGAEKTFFDGKCSANGEAGFNLSTEGAQIIGQNSNLYSSGKISFKPGKNKKGLPDHRFMTNVGAAVYYFPEKGSVSGTRIGQMYSVGIQSTHRINRKSKGDKSYVQPFLTLYVPLGKQLFDEFNDSDAYSRIGLRFIFK